MVYRGNNCRLTYFITSEDNIAAGDLVICRFLSKIEGVEKVGGQSSCLQPGMLMCQFDSENKIIAAEIVFDGNNSFNSRFSLANLYPFLVMGYMQQLQVKMLLPNSVLDLRWLWWYPSFVTTCLICWCDDIHVVTESLLLLLCCVGSLFSSVSLTDFTLAGIWNEPRK